MTAESSRAAEQPAAWPQMTTQMRRGAEAWTERTGNVKRLTLNVERSRGGGGRWTADNADRADDARGAVGSNANVGGRQ
jgi:hypothetical protein